MLQYCPADITEKFGKESFGMKKKYIGTVFLSSFTVVISSGFLLCYLLRK